MPRPLTTEEYVPVHIATLGERSTHRVWPREVVRKFAAAELTAPRATQEMIATAAAGRGRTRSWRHLVLTMTSMFQP